MFFFLVTKLFVNYMKALYFLPKKKNMYRVIQKFWLNISGGSFSFPAPSPILWFTISGLETRIYEVLSRKIIIIFASGLILL